MKAHFKNLLEHNFEANQKFIEKLFSSRNEKIVSTMSHILNAQYVWNERMLQRKPFGDAWDDIPTHELYEKNENNLISSMAILNNFNFNSTIEYRNSKNERFFNKTYEIFSHIISHSSYHRGQIAGLFELEGITPPTTDYIFYQRSLGKPKKS